MKKIKNATLILLLLTSFNICGQSTTEAAVMKPINLLFEGMLKADTAMVKSAFDEDAKLFSSHFNIQGKHIVVEEDLVKFIQAIALKPKDSPAWIEKLLSTEIKEDSTIAQVWTPYSFYVGDKFSHCGVNAFQLIKRGDDWKIIHIMDTRRKKGCD
jgi:hypothetical protein